MNLKSDQLIREWHNPRTTKSRRADIEYELRQAGYIVHKSVVRGQCILWVESEAKTS